MSTRGPRWKSRATGTDTWPARRDPGRDPGSRAAPVGRLSIIQAVRSDAFAGVERYMCQVSNGLASRGHHLMVIGGDPDRMHSELSSQVDYRTATTVLQTARALGGRRHVDVVHAHMTAAEGAAWLARPVQRAPIVATRHFPGDRGQRRTGPDPGPIGSRVHRPRHRHQPVRGPEHRGPPRPPPQWGADRPQADARVATVLMLQRLTRGEAPELGIRVWAESGARRHGWRLWSPATVICRLAGQELASPRISPTASTSWAGLRHRPAAGRVASILLAPPRRAVRALGGRGHGPRGSGGGGPGRRPLRDLGDDSLLFPPGDARPPRGARAAGRDRGLRRQVGARLRERQQQLFSLEQHLDGLEDLYTEVVGSHGRRRRVSSQSAEQSARPVTER